MALTEQDWKQSLQRQPVREKPVHTAFLEQAVVDSRLLTGSREWDQYLQRLQSKLETAQAELRMWQERIGGAYSSDDIRLVQNNVNIWNERIRTLTECMDMPTEIIKHAAELGLIPHEHN